MNKELMNSIQSAVNFAHGYALGLSHNQEQVNLTEDVFRKVHDVILTAFADAETDEVNLVIMCQMQNDTEDDINEFLNAFTGLTNGQAI